MKVDYSKTFIYKLCCNDVNVNEIYIGHSTNYKLRNNDHKKCCNNPNSKKYNSYKYKFIRENGGYQNWKMIQLYDFPCNSKRAAESEEDKTMRELNATLNSQRSYVTEEEKKEQEKKTKNKYRENNKEHLKEYEAKRKNNSERIEYVAKRNEKRKEKAICEFCNTELRKDSLKRHQKTISCLKHQECMILD